MTIAKAGEKVTCENGHHICTVGRDIDAGDVWVEDAFVDWVQPEPVIAAPFPIKCADCGAYWIAYDGICVNGEWRTYLPAASIKVEEIAPGSYRIQGTKIIWRKP